MKMYQLLAAAIPSAALAVSIDFESVGPGTFANQGFLVDGYIVQHAGSFGGVLDSGAEPYFNGNDSHVLYSFNRSWITLSSLDGSGFDALGFDGSATWNFDSRLWASGIMVEGQTLDGEYRSQIMPLDYAQSGAAGMTTFHLDGEFQNLVWLRFSGMGVSPEFALDNLQLRSSEDVVNPTNVPEGGPGLLVVAFLLTGLFWVHRRNSHPSMSPVLIKRPRKRSARRLS